MQKKSNTVQHFKIQASKSLKHFKLLLNLSVFILLMFSSLEWGFKALLALLLGLEYWRQQIISSKENKIIALEIRHNKLLLMRQNDERFQKLEAINLKQNRIFTELELHLNDEVRSEFICQDSFTSQYDYCSLMQYLRFNR